MHGTHRPLSTGFNIVPATSRRSPLGTVTITTPTLTPVKLFEIAQRLRPYFAKWTLPGECPDDAIGDFIVTMLSKGHHLKYDHRRGNLGGFVHLYAKRFMLNRNESIGTYRKYINRARQQANRVTSHKAKRATYTPPELIAAVTPYLAPDAAETVLAMLATNSNRDLAAARLGTDRHGLNTRIKAVRATVRARGFAPSHL